jgi:hypothetical protein
MSHLVSFFKLRFRPDADVGMIGRRQSLKISLQSSDLSRHDLPSLSLLHLLTRTQRHTQREKGAGRRGERREELVIDIYLEICTYDKYIQPGRHLLSLLQAMRIYLQRLCSDDPTTVQYGLCLCRK